MTVGDTDCEQGHVLGVGLDALADDRTADLAAELHEAGDEGMDRRVALERVDPLQVELDGARAKGLDVAQAGVPGTRVVDGDLDARTEASIAASSSA